MANIEGNEILRRGGSYSTAVITTWQLVRQNIEGNYSIIKLRQYFIYNGGTKVNSSYSSFGVLGTEFKNGAYTYYPGNTLLGSKDITVYHNTDGTFPQTSVGMWSYSFHLQPSQETWGNIGAGAVARIPRNANVTDGTNFTDEENPKVYFNNPGGFNLTFKIEAGGDSNLILRNNVSNPSSPYIFELTEAERNKLRAKCPNSNSLAVRLTVGTIIGGQVQNWSWIDKEMSLVNANPRFNYFEFKDIQSNIVRLTGNNQNIVNGYSNVRITIPVARRAISQKESGGMVKYRFICGNESVDKSYSSSSDVIADLIDVQSSVFNVYAIDSRNNSTLVTKTANKIINYTPLQKSSISVKRQGGISEIVTLTFSGKINLVNFGAITNSILTAKYRYRPTDSSTWTSYKSIALKPDSNGNFSFSSTIEGDAPSKGFNVSNSYIFEVYVEDELSSITYTSELSSGTPNLSLDKKGVGIMCKYEPSKGGLLQVGGSPIIESGSNENGNWIKFSDGTMICTKTYIYPEKQVVENWGSLYIKLLTEELVFPQKFIAIPFVNYNIFPTTSNGCWSINGTAPTITTTSIRNLYIARPTQATVIPEVNLIAIGRWK